MLLVIVGRFIEGDEAVNLMPPNTRCSRPACGWRSGGRLSFTVHPTAGGRVNGVADEPRWLRPPAVAEPADGTDGPAGPGSSPPR